MKWIYHVGLRIGGIFGVFEIIDGMVISNDAKSIFQQIAGWMLQGFGLLTVTVAAGLMAIHVAIKYSQAAAELHQTVPTLSDEQTNTA
jgi:hypothetical protein